MKIDEVYAGGWDLGDLGGLGGKVQMRTDVAFIGFVGFVAFLSTDDPEGQKQDMDTQFHVDGRVCKQRCTVDTRRSRFKSRKLGLGCLSQAKRWQGTIQCTYCQNLSKPRLHSRFGVHAQNWDRFIHGPMVQIPGMPNDPSDLCL